MATERTNRSQWPALLIPDPRWKWSALSASSYAASETPLPGVPVPDSTQRLSLLSGGEIGAGTAYEVATQQGGNVGRLGATYRWRISGETDWYGWDAPTVLTGYQAVVTSNSAGATVYNPYILALDSGDLLAVWGQGTAGTAVYTAIWSGGSWGAESEIDLGADGAAATSPALCKLSDGKILLFAWITDGVNAQIRMMISADDGLSWTVGSSAVLPEEIANNGGGTDYVLGRIRVAAIDGQICMLVHIRNNDNTKATQDEIRQYASCDSGHSFTLVDQTDRTLTGADQEGGAYPEIIAANGYFYLSWLHIVTVLPIVYRIGSAYQGFHSVSSVSCAPDSENYGTLDGASKYFTDGDLWMAADPTGVLYSSGRLPTVTNQWIAFLSADSGDSWEPMARSSASSGAGKWWDANDAGTYPRDAAACWWRGCVAVLTAHAANPNGYDVGSLSLLTLGGASQAPMPGYDAWRTDTRQVTFGTTYIPWDLPGDVAWTKTSGGAPTEALNAALLLSLSSGIGESIYYSKVPTTTVAGGIIVSVQVKTTGGTAKLRIDTADGSEGYSIQVEITTTLITVKDLIANSTIDTAGTSGELIQLIIGITGGVLSLWYTEDDPIRISRSYTRLIDSHSLTDAAGVGTTSNLIRFGQWTVGGTSLWRMVNYIGDESASYTGTGLGAIVLPDDLLGRRYATLSTEVGVATIQASGGPTFAGDTWTISESYEYGPERIHQEVSVSPQSPARLDNSQLNTLDYTISAATSTDWEGLSVGMAVLNCNVPLMKLQGYDSGSLTWIDVVSYDSSLVSGRSYTRKGQTVTVTSGNAVYVYRGQLAGYYIDLGGGKVRKIANNSEGQLGGSTSVRAILRLDSVDETEGTSGTCTVYANSALAWVAKPTTYAVYRLRIAAQTTLEGYCQIGKVVIGNLWALSRPPGQGRMREWAPQVEVVRMAGGAQAIRQVGKMLRRVELPFDAQPTSQLYASAQAPDWFSLDKSSDKHQDMYSEILGISGILGQLGASRAVYCERIDQAASATATQMVLGDPKLIYCSITDAFSAESQRGDEWRNELLSGRGLVLQEEP